MDGQRHEGLVAIHSWITESRSKYGFAMLEADVGEESVVMLVELSGDFPGSPLELDYTFRIFDEKITSLEIV